MSEQQPVAAEFDGIEEHIGIRISTLIWTQKIHAIIGFLCSRVASWEQRLPVICGVKGYP